MILRSLRKTSLAKSNFTLFNSFNKDKVQNNINSHPRISYANHDILSMSTYSASILKTNIYQFSSNKNKRTKFSPTISSNKDLY